MSSEAICTPRPLETGFLYVALADLDGTHFVDQVGLELTEFRLVGLKACTTIAQLKDILDRCPLLTHFNFLRTQNPHF
ncbi:hypothetical protein ACQP3J_28060, partial [Escherichia coli]